MDAPELGWREKGGGGEGAEAPSSILLYDCLIPPIHQFQCFPAEHGAIESE